jgi:hypothetical protein
MLEFGMIPMSHPSEMLRAMIKGLIADRHKYFSVPESYREKEAVIDTTASFQFVRNFYFFVNQAFGAASPHQSSIL